jgi:glutathione synthase
MGGLAQKATVLHRRLLRKLGMERKQIEASVPDNQPIDLLAEGLHKAWKKFDNSKAAVLVVVENVNQNQPDQRYVEYELERLEYGIKIIRVTLTEAFEKLVLFYSYFKV